MTYATPADVAVELRGSTTVSTEEQAQWQQWLDRVERDISRAFRRRGLYLNDQIAKGDPDADTVKDIEVAAVARKVENPSGDTSTTVSIDDGSVTRRKEGAGTVAGLDLTNDEWAKLFPAMTSGAFSIRPYHEPDRRHCEWF